MKALFAGAVLVGVGLGFGAAAQPFSAWWWAGAGLGIIGCVIFGAGIPRAWHWVNRGE